MSHIQARRRLLDMLAGWEQYVSKCAEDGTLRPQVSGEEYAQEAEAIGALYQEVGAIENMSDFAVSEFLDKRVRPILDFGRAGAERIRSTEGSVDR